MTKINKERDIKCDVIYHFHSYFTDGPIVHIRAHNYKEALQLLRSSGHESILHCDSKQTGK